MKQAKRNFFFFFRFMVAESFFRRGDDGAVHHKFSTVCKESHCECVIIASVTPFSNSNYEEKRY